MEVCFPPKPRDAGSLHPTVLGSRSKYSQPRWSPTFPSPPHTPRPEMKQWSDFPQGLFGAGWEGEGASVTLPQTKMESEKEALQRGQTSLKRPVSGSMFALRRLSSWVKITPSAWARDMSSAPSLPQTSGSAVAGAPSSRFSTGCAWTPMYLY